MNQIGWRKHTWKKEAFREPALLMEPAKEKSLPAYLKINITIFDSGSAGSKNTNRCSPCNPRQDPNVSTRYLGCCLVGQLCSQWQVRRHRLEQVIVNKRHFAFRIKKPNSILASCNWSLNFNKTSSPEGSDTRPCHCRLTGLGCPQSRRLCSRAP